MGYPAGRVDTPASPDASPREGSADVGVIRIGKWPIKRHLRTIKHVRNKKVKIKQRACRGGSRRPPRRGRRCPERASSPLASPSSVCTPAHVGVAAGGHRGEDGAAQRRRVRHRREAEGQPRHVRVDPHPQGRGRRAACDHHLRHRQEHIGRLQSEVLRGHPTSCFPARFFFFALRSVTCPNSSFLLLLRHPCTAMNKLRES